MLPLKISEMPRTSSATSSDRLLLLSEADVRTAGTRTLSGATDVTPGELLRFAAQPTNTDAMIRLSYTEFTLEAGEYPTLDAVLGVTGAPGEETLTIPSAPDNTAIWYIAI